MVSGVRISGRSLRHFNARQLRGMPKGDGRGVLSTHPHHGKTAVWNRGSLLAQGPMRRGSQETMGRKMCVMWRRGEEKKSGIYPCKTKTSQETQKGLQKFLQPNRNPKVICTDNSMEFGKACEDLSWNHCTSAPHRSTTNRMAEKGTRRVKEGTSAVVLQSGLNES